MNTHEFLSNDGRAVLLLCSAFGLADEQKQSGASPFTLTEWNELALQIQSSPLKTPAAMLDRSAAEIAATLSLAADEAQRIADLLGRAGHVVLELENLFSRGMWAVTRVDEQYPAKLRDTLKHQAPTVLFGGGDIGLLRRAGLAVVGSRDIDAAGIAFAQEVGRKAAAAKRPVVAGGARGTDRLAMQAALEAGGQAFGVLADSLERTFRQADVRQFLLEGQLVLLTPYAPTAGFSVGAAMGRNKIIYGLAEHAVVVSSDFQTGGTWAGAVEALKAGWCPVFARAGDGVPKGNCELIKKGALALDEGELGRIDDLPAWLGKAAVPGPAQADLFGAPASEGSKRRKQRS
ncbi:MAG: DNA-protecting protein DprA [Verrucomicrobia bacterium]|nr:DNA-protecting protein DprA [Verrucomicrobiota bacterium]